MSQWDFRSRSADEVQEFLGGIYAENEFKILGKKGPSRTRIYGGDIGDIAQYNVSYSSPFTFLSETNRESFLILACTAGTADFQRGADMIAYEPGCIAPISATRESRVRSGDCFAHISTHISAEAVNSFCSRLLGRPIDKPVLFDHTPFSDELKAHWRLVIRSLDQLFNAKHPSDIAISSLNEYAIALLLEKHPHNYSASLEDKSSASARAVDEAKDFMDRNADRAIGVADAAAFAGCGVRALHKGFCERLGLTPRAYLYAARLASARSRLTNEGEPTSAAEVAQSYGFNNFEQFESAYRARYNETPQATFRKHFRWGVEVGSECGKHQASGPLTAAKVDLLRHYINVSIGEKLTVERLSAVVGMSPQSFAVAFKKAFRTTPAQYVLSERLDWARWLLSNTTDSISAVAAETGFSSQSHLTSALKRRNGQTPYELRKASRLF